MTSTATSAASAGTGEAVYVYGIVPADTPVDIVQGSGMEHPVELVVDGDVGALVEEVDPDRPLGRRRDLVAHSTVLNTTAAEGWPVLPMRFGSVVPAATVVTDLLAPQQGHFLELLAQVRGHVQFNLRARYVLDTVLADVVRSDEEVAELRRRTADLPEDATHYDRIRLGELVSRAVDVRREQDARLIADRLATAAVDLVVREPGGMDGLTEVALLVESDRQDKLERVAEVLAEEYDGRARLSLVGPMALYDFVPEQ